MLCACSTFAIGVCGECGKPVCGKHSAISGDLRLCDAHLAAEQDKIEQARKDDARLLSWDNGNYNIWSVPLATWLDAHAAKGVR